MPGVEVILELFEFCGMTILKLFDRKITFHCLGVPLSSILLCELPNVRNVGVAKLLQFLVSLYQFLFQNGNCTLRLERNPGRSTGLFHLRVRACSSIIFFDSLADCFHLSAAF
jgi:hypothetical protein